MLRQVRALAIFLGTGPPAPYFPELAGRFDYLFIDKAGQVSLANAVAVSLSTRSLILVGDQMQLSQPTQGSHPGDTGLSCLESLLHGRAVSAAEDAISATASPRGDPYSID